VTDTTSPAAEDGGWRERFAQRSAEVPFRLKVAIVWAATFVVLGFFFWIAAFDNHWMVSKIRFIAGGLVYTGYIAVGGIILAILLAIVGALGRLSRNPVAYGLSGFYTSFFRGTPLIVQLFLIYSALPVIGLNLETRFPGLPDSLQGALVMDAATVGIIGLGLNYGAYMTEIFRAGIQSVSGGQGEAADALGMTYGQKMRKVVLPQAFRVIIPPTGNEFIAMMKDTALVSILGVTAASAEVFRRAQLVGKHDFKPLEAYVVAAGLYWLLTAVFTVFQRKLETRVEKGYVRTTAGPDRAAKDGGLPPSVGRPHGQGGM
jgi:polar amino acid transport system permease protein